ncbi:MAG: hypothetical protein A3G75_05400 [Verrucomicrobia bacterium RIFCSPLOWO2_12_FULL_64_8]|nr:MAG: hypothetical protein A3G75_05400 [Verrucomicrobia bacterium RIFCSPLOWO2_12_FULL_64_8]
MKLDTEIPISTTDIPALSPTLMGETPNRPTQQESGKPLPAGTLIGQYVIEEQIGRGGMGAVYRGRHTMLDRTVAIKVLPADLAADTEFIARFKREANALARLQHPNIVAVYDMGIQGDLYYFVMEFVEGVNLRSLLHHKQIKPEQALAIVPRLCEALEYAHEQGVVHRDIKPENIMLDKRGEPKIADFGLAKIVKGDRGRTLVTQTQTVMGTVDYMAPEQREATKTADHRSDIYSLGVVLYEMLTGDLPIGRFAVPSKKAQIDARLDGVVLRALEYEPELRFQHASELGKEVSRITHGDEGAGDAALNIGQCLNDALSVYRRHWLLLAGVSFVAGLMSMLSCGILGGAAQGGMILLALRALRRPDRRVEFSDLFGAFNRWFALLVVLMVYSLGSLLIVPGILWMFAVYFVIERRRGPVEALCNSWRLVRNVGLGSCFFLWMVMFLIMIGPQALPYMFSLQEIPIFGDAVVGSVGGGLQMFVAPLGILMIASGWNQLMRSKAAEKAEGPVSRKSVLVVAAILLLGFCGFVTLIGTVITLQVMPEIRRSLILPREAGAIAALRNVAVAQERFRADDADRNGERDYWTHDLAGLHDFNVDGNPIGMIDASLANADAAPSNVYDLTTARSREQRNGYWFRLIPDARPNGYMVVAYPDEYGTTGERTFILNEDGKIYSNDNGGRVVTAWPSESELVRDWKLQR